MGKAKRAAGGGLVAGGMAIYLVAVPLILAQFLIMAWLSAAFVSRVFPGWAGITIGLLLSPAIGWFLPLLFLFVSGWREALFAAMLVWGIPIVVMVLQMIGGGMALAGEHLRQDGEPGNPPTE